MLSITKIKGATIYGNKGNVWANECHAYRSHSTDGFELVFSGNVCGTPALATNWARIEGITKVGCKRCLEILKQEGTKKSQSKKKKR
jgi:hypothetical protein